MFYNAFNEYTIIEQTTIEVKGGLLELTQNVTIAEEMILLLSHLQRSATVLREQNAITNLAVHGNELSVGIHTAGSASKHLELIHSTPISYSSLVSLGHGGLGKENTSSSLSDQQAVRTTYLSLHNQSLDENSISEGDNLLLGYEVLEMEVAYHEEV